MQNTLLKDAFGYATQYLKDYGEPVNIIEVMEHFNPQIYKLEQTIMDLADKDGYQNLKRRNAFEELHALKASKQFLSLLLERQVSPEDQARRLISGDLHMSDEEFAEKYERPMLEQAAMLYYNLSEDDVDMYEMNNQGYRLEDIKIFLAYIK